MGWQWMFRARCGRAESTTKWKKGRENGEGKKLPLLSEVSLGNCGAAPNTFCAVARITFALRFCAAQGWEVRRKKVAWFRMTALRRVPSVEHSLLPSAPHLPTSLPDLTFSS